MSALARSPNQPNLDRVGYRLGTFTSFRRAMLGDLPRALPGWRASPAGRDRAEAVLELWAYVADVLTFYQELIANEAFLGTASRSDSLRRLAELVGYRPSPGSAAETLLAFAATPGTRASIPAGLRVSSQPDGDRPAAIFETDAPLAARAEHNAIALSRFGVVDQFAADQLAAGAAPPPTATRGPSLLPDAARAARRTVVFEGTGLRIRPGAYVLLLDRPYELRSGAPRFGNGQLRQIVEVTEDPRAATTSLTWLEDPDTALAQTPQVFAFRIEGAPFGHLAAGPAGSLPHGDETVLELDAVYAGIVPRAGAPSFVVLVDTETARKSFQLLAVTDVDTVTATRVLTLPIAVPPAPASPRPPVHADVDADAAAEPPAEPPTFESTISARVSRLRLDHAIYAGPAPGQFSLRGTRILAGSEPLTPARRAALPERLTGAALTLDGLYPELEPGRQVVIRGAPLEGGALQAESALLGLITLDEQAGTTNVTLRPPLQGVYARSTTKLLANVVPASQGETVRDEILGSGDGSSWQAFRLRKRPLTYLPTASEDAEQAVESTLRVTVDGVRWLLREGFLGAAAGARAFVTRDDDSGTTTVLFGDTTARPPSGRDNVRARYRQGIGTAGQVPPDAIGTLVDSVPGLQRVTNPTAASGAADRERPEEIRANAPSRIRTFGRAVSVEDYATLARTYPGVDMARSAWVRSGAGASPEVQLTVAGRDRRALAADTTRGLRRFLDARRDVNVALRIVPASPVYVDVRAVIDVLGAYGRRATLVAALAAMNPHRNPDGSLGFFAALGFGESVHLSAVYARLQLVPGVEKVAIRTLRIPPGDPRERVRDRIPVPVTALAVIANDPDDPGNARGRLAIELGAGGFAD